MVVASTDRITLKPRIDAPAVGGDDALTENAVRVLRARYLTKDERGVVTETPDDLFDRVAETIADVETTHYGANEAGRSEWKARFKALMTSGRFMPNSPTLMNAGRSMGMLSACFVLPVPDSIDGIFNSIKHTALIQKAGGGTGFAFDALRPTGDYIKSSGGTTSGPISFWRAFSEATNAIQQGAFRRGANMGMMYVHHPDILKFLFAKQDLSQFTNYNISVKVTDAWMEAFQDDPDGPHVVENPRNGARFYLPRDLEIWGYDIRSLIPQEAAVVCRDKERNDGQDAAASVQMKSDGRTIPVYTRRDIWNIIVKHAWQTGEPGVVFMDRINDANPTPHVGRMEATNPCGEQPLLPYEACNLGSVNLGPFVTNPCTPQAEVDWDALRETVHESVRFLDNVIDANNYPLPEIDDICKANRKIGLGVMGFADALFKLGVRYNSENGVAWGERFMQFVNDEAHAYSEKLARQRGNFPHWAGSVWDTQHGRPMRNACVTTVAPTGTISIIANCSGGIEPMFSLAFFRNVLKGQDEGKGPMIEINETFKRVAEARGFHSEGLMEQIATEGTLAHISGVPDDVRHVFVCAHDIEPLWHVRMQAAFQRHCDASISKTINFPHDAAPDDVEQIYRTAYELECKGVTVYRDGCRSSQPMALAGSDRKHRTMAGGADASSSATRAAAPSPAAAAAGRAAADAADPDVASPAPERPATLPATSRIAVHAASPTPPAVEPPPAAPGDVAAAGSSAAAPAVGTGSPSARREVTTERDLFGERITTVRPPATPTLRPRELPDITSGIRIRQQTPFGNMHIQITVDPRDERELEVFAQLGKGGDLANSDLEAICRMVSLWLRAGGGLGDVVKQLSGIGCSLQLPTRHGRIMSLADGLARALKRYTRAKERHGLRALLLGEIDPADIEQEPDLRSPAPSGGNGGHAPVGQSSTLSSVHTPHGDKGAPSTAGRSSAERVGQSSTLSTGRFREAGQGPNERVGQSSALSSARSSAAGAPAPDVESAFGNGESHAAARPDRLTGGLDGVAPDADLTLTAARRLPGLHTRLRPTIAGYRLKCPECGGDLDNGEGCMKCHNCGYAQC